MAMTKVERQELLAKDQEITHLKNHIANLERARVASDDSPGHILIDGYGDHPIPLGKYFRLRFEKGQSAGLEVTVDYNVMGITCADGVVMALPRTSNVINIILGRNSNAGVKIAHEI